MADALRISAGINYLGAKWQRLEVIVMEEHIILIADDIEINRKMLSFIFDFSRFDDAE